MKLSKPTALVASAVLTVLEAVQLQISMSIQVHDVMTMVIVILVAAGLPALAPGAVLAGLPPHLVAAITAGVGSLIVLVQSLNIGGVWHTVVAVVVIGVSSLVVGPVAIPITQKPDGELGA